jgi:hypothetical protein
MQQPTVSLEVGMTSSPSDQGVVVIRKPAATLLVLSLAVLALALVPAAGLAAKGGNGASQGGGGKPGGGGGSSSLTLVVVSSPYNDGLPHYGGTVTFDVSTTATAKPTVKVECNQGGVVVYRASAGFYPEYPWQWARNFSLGSGAWTGGAADCVATMYYVSSNGRTNTLATLPFQVLA